ncbi:MAG: PQQ-dependent sugar dehydrogenase, partial [Brevundimonas sp.]
MRPIVLAASASLLVLTAACGANGQDAPAAPGAPVETRPANNPDQKPAFDGQTRAPGVQTAGTLRNETIASGLVHPWG